MGCIRVEKITEYLCEPLSRCLKDEVNDCLSACLFVSLSLSVCLFVSLCLSVCFSACLFVSLCPFVCLFVSLYPSVRLFVSPCLSVCLLVPLRLCISVCIRLAVRLSVGLLSICLYHSVCLFVERVPKFWRCRKGSTSPLPYRAVDYYNISHHMVDWSIV